MRSLWRLLVAGLELSRLAWALRFRLSGPYMRWREETAFGHERSRWPGAAERRRAIIDYANWCASMRRLSRGRRG